MSETKQPMYPDEPDYVGHPVDSSIFNGDVRGFTSYVFDEVIMLGLAACGAAAKSNSTSFDGKEMFAALLETSFVGVTGTVRVNSETGTRLPATALFSLVNFVQEDLNETHVVFRTRESVAFIDGEWIEQTPYIFNDGTTDVPGDLPGLSLNYNYIGTGLRAAGLIMAGVIIFLSVAFATWTMTNRSVPVVLTSQPIFLLLICAGTFFLASTIIPLSIDDDVSSSDGCDIACMTVPWLSSTGFALVFSALFAKTWRVNRLFRDSSFRRIKVNVSEVMTPLIVVMFLNWAVLVTWTAISPLQWNREPTSFDAFDREVSSRGYCTSDHFLLFVIILLVIDLGALSVAAYQSYLARKISTQFAESEYIAQNCMLLVSFVGIPTMIIVSDEPRAYYFVMASIIFVLCASVLLFIFVPKIIYARANDGMDGIKSAMALHGSVDPSHHSSKGAIEDHSSSNGAMDGQETENESIESLRAERDALRAENKRLLDSHQMSSISETQAC